MAAPSFFQQLAGDISYTDEADRFARPSTGRAPLEYPATASLSRIEVERAHRGWFPWNRRPRA